MATYADLVTPAMLNAYLGRLVAIDRGRGDPLNVATVADIEPGLLTVSEGTAKVKAWAAQHRQFPTAYSDRNDWAAVEAELTGVHHYSWISTLDGTILPDGKRPAVVQAWGEAAIGFHADMSVVWDETWHPIRPAVSWAQLNAMAAEVAALARSVQLMR